MKAALATLAALTFALQALATSAQAQAKPQERLGAVPPSSYDANQAAAAKAFEAARGRPPWGPFAMLMRSPDLMTSARSMGDYLRYKSAIGNTLSELVVITTARFWSQDYEWNLHAPIAVKQGVAQSVVDAIRDGRRPTGMTDDEAICYDFTMELDRTHQVSDATYARALKRFGEKGVIDLAGIGGYYTLLAMTMNAAHSDPEGPVRLSRLAPR